MNSKPKAKSELPPESLPSTVELKKLKRLANRVAAGKEKIHLLLPPPQ